VDAVLRPIYTKHGLRISFGTAEGAPADHVRVTCRVSLGFYDEDYHIDMPADGKGAKGGDVMTRTHAAGAAVTHCPRYLLLMVFNIATGDNDGNGRTPSNETGELITPQQLAKIDELVKATKTDIARLCAYLKIECLPDLRASSFDSVVKMLERKREKQN